ncbi:hypothetical protein ACS0TY_001468 [Phlomoides rotata]
MVYTSSGYFIEWSVANYGAWHRATAALQGGSGCDAWHVPPAGKWKVNVDATFFRDSYQIGNWVGNERRTRGVSARKITDYFGYFG